MKLYVIQFKQGSADFGAPMLLNENQFKVFGTQNYQLLGTIEVQEPGKECQHEYENGNPPFVSMAGFFKCVKCSKYISQLGKTVTKEAGWIKSPELTESGNQEFNIYVPVNAKNIKCTYEVEE